MKQIFIILVFLFGIYNNAITQNDDILLKNEWTANINFFVNDLIFSQDLEEDIINYKPSIESLVSYKRFLNKKFAWQVGVSFYNKFSEEEFIQTLGHSQSQSKKGYYLRIGFQKYHHLSTKVKMYFGTDLQFSFQKYKAHINLIENSSGFDQDYIHINREKGIGVIPYLGFRWELNSRISFSTETSLIASAVFFDFELDSPFSGGPIINGELSTLQEDSEKISFGFHAPLVLLFNLRF